MSKGKTAFIASGGGMLCAYSAGVARAFQDSAVGIDIFIGSSGSAGTMSYFASGQAEKAAQLWIEEVSKTAVIRPDPLRLDVDFIVDSMRDHFTLDEKRLRAKTVDLFLATTKCSTLKTQFFSNHDNVDWYEVMRASMAIPFVYGKKVLLDGDLYFDGDIRTSIGDCILKAKDTGAETIYVCETKNLSFKDVRYIVWSLTMGEFTILVRGAIKKLLFRHSVKDVKVVSIRPSKKLSVGILNNTRQSIEDAVSLGYTDAVNLLRSF